MATRATITVKDDRSTFHIYKHWDGYPDGILPYIEEAKEHSWDFPRFEAGDFAAALIKVMKSSEGDVYLTMNASLHGDRSYHYEISCEKDGSLNIDTSEFKSYSIDES